MQNAWTPLANVVRVRVPVENNMCIQYEQNMCIRLEKYMEVLTKHLRLDSIYGKLPTKIKYSQPVHYFFGFKPTVWRRES